MHVYTLISQYYNHNPHGHYFDHDTLKFFGERVSEMRILKERVNVTDYSGAIHECYVLSKYQRNHPCGPRRVYAYFDVNTFCDVIPCHKEGGAGHV